MIGLMASSPDGWAIGRERDDGRGDDVLWLVRPPYKASDRTRITIEQIARALVDEDFVPISPERTFAGWRELCRHLEEVRVAGASPEEIQAAAEAPLRILARADAQQVRRHLDAIRKRLAMAPGPGVKTALLALLCAESVKQAPELLAEARELLEIAERAGNEREV